MSVTWANRMTVANNKRRRRNNHKFSVEPLEPRFLLAAAPVAYWAFDNAADIGEDSSGSGSHLNTFGDAAFDAGGQTGGALVLDGDGDYLGGVTPVDLPVGSSTYSIAAWIKPDVTGSKGIVSWGGYPTLLRYNTFGLTGDNGLRNEFASISAFNITASNTIVSNAGIDFDDGNWHHVVVSRDSAGGTRTLYADGQELITSSAPSGSITDASFGIGSANPVGGGQFFDGLLDDVAIWNIAIDANQVASLYNGTSPLELREAGLAGQWVADDLNGTFADGDTVGVWNDSLDGISAIGSGNITLEKDELNGHSVLRFDPGDGNDQFRVDSAANPLAEVADFSVAVVFRAGAAGVGDNSGQWFDNTGLVDAQLPGDADDWGLALTADGQIGAGLGSPDITRYSLPDANFADGQAHVAIYTRAGGEVALYVDNFGDVSRTDGAAGARANSDLTFGSLQTNLNYFSGDIAEIVVYNKDLSEMEATSLASQFIAKYDITPPTVPVQVAGELLVDLKATDPSAGAAVWRNAGSLDDFSIVGDPVVEEISGVTAVSFNSDNPASGWDDAYQGPLAPANITGNGIRSIEVWAYNPSDGLQNDEETMVAWGRRGGPGGSNLSFGYGRNATWGAVGHWGTPDMPWFPGGSSPTLGQWHHMVYTFDGSTARVYADGELTNSEFTGILGTHAGTTINLAAQNGPGGVLDLTQGQAGSVSLANVRVHTGVLTDAQVASNFESGIQLAGDPPEVMDDGYEVDEDDTLNVPAPGLLGNDSDPNDLELKAILDEGPTNGSLALNLDGSFSYTPDPHYNGADSFTYRANNPQVPSEPATVTITVNPQYDPGVAVADTYVVDVSQVFSRDATSGVLSNDQNIDGLPLTAELVTDLTPGQLSLQPDGSFTYDPQGAKGNFTFTYRVNDTVMTSPVVPVTLVVDTPPAADNDGYSVDEDDVLTVSAANGVLDGDVDAEDDALTAVLVDDVSDGTLDLNSDGSFTYTPNDNFFGTDSFTYRANDGDQDSPLATVTLTVDPVNDAPVAASDRYFGFENQQLIRGVVQGVLSNDLDVDGPALHAILVDPPASGDLDFHQDGSFTFTPEVGFLGTETFTYKVSDTLAESNTVSVDLIINSQDQQVVINEINYDPVDNTVKTEFIELYNAGASPVDLSNWFFSDGVSYTIPGETVMQPDSYLLVAEDPATIQSVYNISSLGPWVGTLTNDGEEITLRNAVGDVVDRVDYGVAFPWPTGAAGDGGSMELIHSSLDNDLGGSWRTSTGGSPTAPMDPVTIIPEFTQSRYLVPTDNSLGTSWTTTTFVDDAWSEGETGIGYENSPADYQSLIRTTVRPTDVEPTSTSVFMRIPFTIDDLSIANTLRLRMKYDDGFVAYINGTEVARQNVTGNPPNYNTTAANHPDGSAVVFENTDIVNADVLLNEGSNNVLAIHGLNQSLTSSDMLVLPALIIPGSEDAPAQPTPGKQNSVFAENAAPQSRQVDHSPQQPTSGEDTKITLKVTDPDGVASVQLQYQIVLPGAYIPAFLPVSRNMLLSDPDTPPEPNPVFFDEANWTAIPMVDDGTGGDKDAGDGTYTATVPGQNHRTLVRYRMVVEDSLGASVRLPYADDPSLNFAYFVYDGVPDYQTTSTTYATDVLESLPVYQFLTRAEDMTEVLAYDNAIEIPQGPDARFVYNWPGTFVYDGEVYDNIKYRLRGANGRYHLDGKRSMRFRFNKGNYFQAKDQDGNDYPTKWRTLTTGKGFDNRQTLTHGLNEVLSLHLYNQIGVPGSDTHWVHFRVIDDAQEAPDQWRGDFWGLNFIIETYDVRFLEAHDLEKGNLYKLINSRGDAASQQRYQAPDAVSNGQDHDNIEQVLNGNSTADFIDAHVDLEKWYLYHALQEAIRHYDYWPNANKNMAYYFEPDYLPENNNLGKLWILPWDTDASWGPTWNNGHEVVYNSIFSASGGGADSGSTPELWPEVFNAVRELRDLVWQPDQINPLIDEFAAIIAEFEFADRARWQNAPSDAGNYNGLHGAGETSLAALVQDMKNFAFAGGRWPGDNANQPARAAFLDTLQGSNGEGARIPFTPTISYIGEADFPTNGLSFQSTNFSDPQGNDTFGAMEWRVAEITDPDAPNYDPTEKHKLEWNAEWESGELTTFDNTIDVPGGVLQSGRTYRARVRFQDVTGRWSHWSDTLEFTTTPPDNAELVREHLRISEIAFDPLGPTSAEIVAGFDRNDDFSFLELVNSSSIDSLDLTGAEMTEGVEFVFAGSDVTALAPGERVVIVEDLDAFQFRYGSDIHVAGQWSGALSGKGEQLVLSDPGGVAILDFAYDTNGHWPSRANGRGSTLQIVDVEGDYQDGNNWTASAEINGSPGLDGVAAVSGLVINEILAHTDPPVVDAIELFNSSNAPIDVSNWFLSDSHSDADAFNKFRIPAGTVLGPGEFLVFDEQDFNATMGVNPNDFALSSFGDDLWLTAGDLGGAKYFVDQVEFGGTRTGVSIGRVPNGTGVFAPQHRLSLGCTNGNPRVGPLVFSEVMYHPTDPTPAELAGAPTLNAGDLEYIELYNPSEGIVDIGDWQLDGGVGLTFAAGTTIGPNQTLVIMSFDPTDPTNADKVAAFENRYSVTVAGNTGFLGGYSGQLNDDGESVQLRQFVDDPIEPLYVLVDEVIYSDQNGWPTSADGTGDALSRSGSTYFGSDATNWSAGPGSPGTTVFPIGVTGDLTGDGNVNAGDIDLLYDEIRRGTTVSDYDVNNSGAVTADDVTFLVTNILNTVMGDINLDGVADGSDFTIWNDNKFHTCARSWSTADLTGDGWADGSDFNVWFANRFTGNPFAAAMRDESAPARPRAALTQVSVLPIVVDQFLAGDEVGGRLLAENATKQDETGNRTSLRLAEELLSDVHFARRERFSARIASARQASPLQPEDVSEKALDRFEDLDFLFANWGR